MKQSVFAFLLLSGLSALRYGHSQQYHFEKTPKNWTEAQSFCRENYTDLLTIDNQTDVQRILNQAQGILNQTQRTMNQTQSGDTDAWIGLQRRWRWSLADRGLYSAKEIFFFNWASREPNNNNGNESCATMRGDGGFHDFSCDNRFYFICYNESSADKYILIREKKTWEDARFFCQKKHTDLVNIKNQTENNIITVKLKGSELDWWIGLSKDWKWSDLSESSYRNWSTESDGNDSNCTAVLLSSGKWVKQECDDKKPFFCYEDNLILVQENKTWDEALEHCRCHHYDLVSVSTETVEHWVKRRARNATTAHVWLGVRYSCALQVWHWVSGDVLCHPSWASEDRGRECGRTGAIESGGGQKQVSLPKTERLNFICSKRLG
ncbi:macrophage mannose receptor 1-like [Anguilla anguilla]|uniref:macrophage mannose receptor 1-like n=1 Tax=Anguilla anguilla TaxID=7936 RepID=UPI0015AD4964|nr:macrophage mannose receptor 1-like [Anguilla anguilla]